MEGLAKLRNVTPDLYRPVTRRPVKATQNWRFGDKITLLRESFENSSIRINTDWRLNSANFMPICSVTKKCEFIVPVTKSPTFFAAILRPFGPWRLNCNKWDLSSAYNILWLTTYACKILSGSVKVCRSYSRKADFEQIHYAVMDIQLHITAYKN